MSRWVLANDLRYLSQIYIGLRQERVEEHVLHKEWASLPYLCLVVVAVCEELDQVGEAIVSVAGWTVRGGDGVGVGTVVRGYLVCPEVKALHDPVPHRRVIHSA